MCALGHPPICMVTVLLLWLAHCHSHCLQHIWWHEIWLGQYMCLLALMADSYSSFSSTLSELFACFPTFFVSWTSSRLFCFLLWMKNISCLPIHTPVIYRNVINLFYRQLYSLINLTCQACKKFLAEFPPPVHLLLPHFFLSSPFFPPPLPFLVVLGGVSAQNNNNDHASMSVSIPAWLLLHCAAILPAEERWKACLQYVLMWKLRYSRLVDTSGTYNPKWGLWKGSVCSCMLCIIKNRITNLLPQNYFNCYITEIECDRIG